MNLAEMNCGSETIKKPKPPKPAAGHALSVVIDKAPHIPLIPPTPVVQSYAKNPSLSVLRKDANISGSATLIPKASFEDVQAVIRDGDVMEEKIKQEARIKIAAAREQANLKIEAARQDAKVLADAIALEQQRVIGLQIIAKEQSILNTQNEGSS